MRVTITCQACGKRLAFLELSPRMRASCYCRTCDATTTTTVDAAGAVSLPTSDDGRILPRKGQE